MTPGRAWRMKRPSSFWPMEASPIRPSRKRDRSRANCPIIEGRYHVDESRCDADRAMNQRPAEIDSQDPEVLRAALIGESGERRRAECRAGMQTEVVELTLDLLAREPDLEGFFVTLTKMMVEESESHTCGVWLIDEESSRCELWM